MGPSYCWISPFSGYNYCSTTYFQVDDLLQPMMLNQRELEVIGVYKLGERRRLIKSLTAIVKRKEENEKKEKEGKAKKNDDESAPKDDDKDTDKCDDKEKDQDEDVAADKKGIGEKGMQNSEAAASEKKEKKKKKENKKKWMIETSIASRFS